MLQHRLRRLLVRLGKKSFGDERLLHGELQPKKVHSVLAKIVFSPQERPRAAPEEQNRL